MELVPCTVHKGILVKGIHSIFPHSHTPQDMSKPNVMILVQFGKKNAFFLFNLKERQKKIVSSCELSY